MIILARALYGSQNYNLDIDQSDKDYKLIALPELNDLYYGKKLALPKKYDKDHYSIMDIRHWVQLLKKGSFNAIEYLFSIEFSYEISINFEKFAEFIVILKRLFTEEQYLAEVWPLFYNACLGLCTQPIKRNGYNAKTVSRMYWITQFLRMIVVNDFNIPKKIFGTSLGASKDIRISKYINNEDYFNTLAALLLEDMDHINVMAQKSLENIRKKNWEPTFFMLDYTILQMIIERIG